MSKRLITGIVIGLSLLTFLARFPESGLNSDTLYPAGVWRDIVNGTGCFNEWSLSPAPYLFPDMALYFLVQTLVNNHPISVVAMVFLGVAFFILGWLWVTKLVAPAEPDREIWLLLIIAVQLAVF